MNAKELHINFEFLAILRKKHLLKQFNDVSCYEVNLMIECKTSSHKFRCRCMKIDCCEIELMIECMTSLH